MWNINVFDWISQVVKVFLAGASFLFGNHAVINVTNLLINISFYISNCMQVNRVKPQINHNLVKLIFFILIITLRNSFHLDELKYSR